MTQVHCECDNTGQHECPVHPARSNDPNLLRDLNFVTSRPASLGHPKAHSGGMNNPPITPESIAAARAAVNRKPADAVLVAADHNAVDTAGHRIPKGSLAWRFLGRANYDGPPDASVPMFNAMHRRVLWTCEDCANRKGWSSRSAMADEEDAALRRSQGYRGPCE